MTYTPSNPVYLSPSDGLPKNKLGEPVFYAWKELLAVGDYRHPADGRPFQVTPKMLSDIVRNAAELHRKTGKLVYVTDKHVDGEPSAADTLGYVVGYDVKGGRLFGYHQLIGDRARRAAAANGSSVFVRDVYTDHDGVAWTSVLEHNAVVPNPVLNLGGFMLEKTIAASAGTRQAGKRPVAFRKAAGVYVLADSTSTGARKMDFLKKLAAMLGLPEDASEDQIMAALAEKLGTAESPDVGAMQVELATLRQKLADAEQKIAASTSPTPAPATPAPAAPPPLSTNPEFIRLATDVEIGKVDRAIAMKRISPAAGAAISKTIRESGLALSTSRGGKSFADLQIELAELASKPVPNGEKTGPQTVRLANTAAKNSGQTAPEREAYLRGLANRGMKPAAAK